MIKAVLRKNCKYTDIDGKTKVVASGDVVSVQVIPRGTTWMDDLGKYRIIKATKYVALIGKIAFYINKSDFKTID